MLKKAIVCVAGLSLASTLALAGPISGYLDSSGGPAKPMLDSQIFDMADPMPEPVVPDELTGAPSAKRAGHNMEVNPTDAISFQHPAGGAMMSTPQRTEREIQKLIRRLG